MNRKLRNFYLLACLIMTLPCLHAEDLLMLQFGKQVLTVSKDNPLTFYDMKGTEDIPSNNNSNSFSTAIFKPAEEGNSIVLSFETVDVRNDGASYPAYLNIYNGVFDTTSVTYPATVGDVSTTKFPTTDALLASLDGTYSDLTYVSSDATGALSVCYHYKYAKRCGGWKAVVSSVKVEDMAIKTATADYSQVNGNIYAGKQNVALAGLTIQTEGLGNPDALTGVSFSLSCTNVIDPATLKLYAGNAASTASLTAIDASVTGMNGTYSFTLSKPLAAGDNQFCIGADVLSSAPFDATVSLNITGITTQKGYSGFQTVTPALFTVARMVLIANTPATYTVEQELDFYDDGGPEGKISNNFEGTVTFIPAHEGMKVQIDFSDISIFYTSSAVSIGNQDLLKIYNGTTAAAENLLYSVETDKLPSLTVKSTSADGALTVYMRSKTPSSYYIGTGFEAKVSEFVPEAMTVGALTVEKTESRTLSAGEKNSPLLGFNIQTVNTEPALSPASFVFVTNGTFPQIATAEVYYTKRSDVFSTAVLAGSATVTGNGVVIAVTDAIALQEGDNYFWLACDIATDAPNGAKVEATLSKVTFRNGTAQENITTPAGDFEIYNIVRSSCGSQEITVYGDWAYTHTQSSYGSNYAAENCNQTVVFRPAVEGNLIQIDYADFAVYYSSSAYYGVRAKYEIYNGSGTAGTKLWEVTADNCNVGPGRVRSSAEDGALTVVFNPNTASSYTDKGWHATVSQYTPFDMKVTEITVEQASVKLVKPGEKAAAILAFDIQTEGMLNGLTLQEITLDLKGSETDVDSVLLFRNGEEISRVPAASTVTLTSDVLLQEYSNRFTVLFNLKADAAIGHSVDAALTHVKVTDRVLQPVNGDPDGARPVKNVYLLQAGDNGQLNVGTNSLMFYDDGGEDADYSSGFEGWVTFVPTVENSAIELVFNDFNCAYGCSFYLYYADGRQENYDASFGYYDKPDAGVPLVSKAGNGALTIYFKAGGYSQMAGWQIEVRCHELMPLKIDSVVTAALAPAVQTIGAADVQLMQAAVYVSGDRGPLSLNAFNTSLEGPATNLRWYAAGHSPVFTSTEPFAAPYALTESGVWYFYAVADVSPEASEGDNITFALQTVTVGEDNIAPLQTVQTATRIVSGVHGTFVIGKSDAADYHTLQSAVNSLAIGIDGPVTFLLESGRYEEQVIVPVLKGVSETNNVLFRSLTGNRDDVEIVYNGSLGDNTGVWTFDGADWVTLEGLSFTSTYTLVNQASVVCLRNASEHITLRNCYIHAASFTEPAASLNLLRLYVVSGSQAFNHHFTLQDSRLEGGYIACYLTGHAAAADPCTEGLNIVGNTFEGQGAKMIYSDGFRRPLIAGNTMTATVRKSGFYAIDNINFADTLTLTGNTVTLTLGGNFGASGIYLRPNGSQDKTALFDMYNNAVSIIADNDYACNGLHLNNNLPLVRIAYNTFRVQSNADYSAPVYFYSKPAEGSSLTNNILLSAVKGQALRYRSASYVGNVTFRHNCLYTPEGNSFAGSVAETFDAWKTLVGATDEQGNISRNVDFVSAAMLMPRTGDGLLSAQPLDYVTTDITGRQRAAQPTVGAYEYDPELTRMPLLLEGYPSVANVTHNAAAVLLRASANGTAYLLVRTAAEAAPDNQTVVTEGTRVELPADREVSSSLTGLQEHTAYTVYVLLANLLGEPAQEALTCMFTTEWERRDIVINEILPQTVNADTPVRFVARLAATYPQAEPYRFVWTDFRGDTLSTDSVLTLTADRTLALKVSVTDAFGTRAAAGTHLQVLQQEAQTATFEEYRLPAESVLTDDETWTDWAFNPIYSGTYAFDAYLQRDWGMCTGFAVSNETSTLYENYSHQFRSAAGGAYAGSNYAVFFPVWGETAAVRPTHTGQPATVRGFYLTNTAWVVDAVRNGDGMTAGGFEQGDWFKLIVEGWNGTEKAGTVEVFLADYRSENAAEHTLLEQWQWVDLSPLGAVSEITFSFDGTRRNAGGLTTPTYFCMDNFNGVHDDIHTGEVNHWSNDAETFMVRTYPNPVTDYLHIVLPQAEGTMEIYTTDGICVMRQDLTSEQIVLNVSNWDTGIYILRICSEDAVATQRIFKR